MAPMAQVIAQYDHQRYYYDIGKVSAALQWPPRKHPAARENRNLTIRAYLRYNPPRGNLEPGGDSRKKPLLAAGCKQDHRF